MNLKNNSQEVKEQVTGNSFWNVINSAINRFGSLILIVLLSRILMPEGFGEYSLAMTISLFFITFSDLGINQTLIRYVSLGIDKKNNDSASYFRYLFKIKLFVTLLLSGILFIIAYPLSIFVFKDQNLFILLIILSFYVFIISLSGFFESLFFIKKNVKYISVKELILLFLKIGAILWVGNFASQGYKLSWIFSLFVIFSILTLFFVFYVSKHSYRKLFKKTKSSVDKKGVKKFILSLNLQNIALMVLFQATIILLGIFLPTEFVGFYNSSLVIVLSLANLFFFSSVFLPILTPMKEKKFKSFIEKTFRLFFTILLPISFGLSILSKFFILTIYGENYLPAATSLSILAFLIPCMVGIDLSLASFSARGKQKKFSILMAVSIPIFLLLNYLFIKIFITSSNASVLTGVSIANLIVWTFCFLTSIWLLKKELKVKAISSWILKPLLSCGLMSICIWLLLKIFGKMDIFKGIILIILGAGIYFISLVLTNGIKKEEIKWVFLQWKNRNINKYKPSEYEKESSIER